MEKGEDYPKWGDTDVYKKLYQAVTYYKMKRLVMHTCELLKQLRVDFTNLRWPERSLIIFGMVGCAWLVLCYQIQGLIAVYLYLALALMLQTRFKT